MILIPYSDFQSSARCLDTMLLGRMRWEVREELILLIFHPEDIKLGSHHPFSRYTFSLVSYGFELCREWKLRGNVDTIEASLIDLYQLVLMTYKSNPDPDWLFDEERMIKERKQLLVRDSSWYSRFWTEEGLLR